MALKIGKVEAAITNRVMPDVTIEPSRGTNMYKGAGDGYRRIRAHSLQKGLCAARSRSLLKKRCWHQAVRTA